MTLEWVDWVLTVTMIGAAAASIMFIAAYAARTWETSPYGRNVMAGSFAIGLVAAAGALHTVTGTKVTALLEAGAWVYAAVVLWRRRILLVRATPRDAGPELIGGPPPHPTTED